MLEYPYCHQLPIIGFYLAFLLHRAPADEVSSTATCSCGRSLDVVLDLCMIRTHRYTGCKCRLRQHTWCA